MRILVGADIIPLLSSEVIKTTTESFANNSTFSFLSLFFAFFFFFLSRFYSGKWHLPVEKQNNISGKFDGSNNDRVKYYSVFCDGCKNTGGVKDVLKS